MLKTLSLVAACYLAVSCGSGTEDQSETKVRSPGDGRQELCALAKTQTTDIRVRRVAIPIPTPWGYYFFGSIFGEKDDVAYGLVEVVRHVEWTGDEESVVAQIVDSDSGKCEVGIGGFSEDPKWKIFCDRIFEQDKTLECVNDVEGGGESRVKHDITHSIDN